MSGEQHTQKRADAPYRSGRSDAWLKIKCSKVARFPIVGFVPAAGNSIAALRLGRREGEDLVYVGKAGTGFTDRSGQDVRARLKPLIRKSAALAKPLKKKDTIWVDPTLEAEVAFSDMTGDGMLRHPSFRRLVG